ncbi:polyprenyl synthetase family protein [Carnobacterium divergens]|uniref:Farnesyl diphosphate synthase n=1 Tax=Carnobacterium divergens TaxID=2748 RepID=A0AAW8R910_CARDV|nr:farnesyl diphosphate synthase [Carnobacterium divergens]MDT1958132.1 polyprenyl synthetase family protein [Carnobacterium divergens]MDT1974135.1 polyprenyl synthetase family protein [Carnobacterium divergens]MDT2011361.1 polyprenyl synthetase family protein [Carnobacterium divergens]
MNLIDFQTQQMPLFEDFLINTLKEEILPNSTLYHAMNYSVSAGGKRIRPLLLLAVLKSFGKNPKAGFEVAAALEYIHTYSLIHDDLPAMDNDALRRGKPTNHIVYGEDMAILAGDGLLTYAFEVIATSPLSNDKKVKLISALAKSAGPTGMVAGQVADMEAEKKQVPLKELKEIHARKTGELLRFAAIAGGIIAEVSSLALNALEQYALHLGLAFQIRDDVMDIIGNVTELGKETGMDAIHEKSTYPNLLTLTGAIEALNEELGQAKKALNYEKNNEVFDASLLNEIADMLLIEER